jgi:hypothetical protein
MRATELAKLLADRSRIGLDDALADRLKIKGEDALRGQLLAQEDDDKGHLGVYLVATYVVDDTDFWDDGEIYWWSIPALVHEGGKASWGPLVGLPSGAAPHKCGSLEWMTNISLENPPLLAVIPPGDDVAACVIRLGFYDDDGELADVKKGIAAGLEVLAGFTEPTVPSTEQLIFPVREAIFRSLKAEADDILIEQDVTLRRGERSQYGVGFIGSIVNAMARVYYFVRDEKRTVQAGPFALHRGQVESIRFDTKLEAGGRLAILTRGADVNAANFGTLTTEVPFVNRVLDETQAKLFNDGFNLSATGTAKGIAFYTPP